MYLDIGSEDRPLQGLAFCGSGSDRSLSRVVRTEPVSPPKITPVDKNMDEPIEVKDSNGLQALEEGGLDPLALQVWESIKNLLSEGELDRVTIQDVAEEVSAGDSAVRLRLNQLVDLGHVECWTGSGRRPSYYFLPKVDSSNVVHQNATSSEDGLMLAQLLEMSRATTEEASRIQKEIESKQVKLESLRKDLDAYKRVISKIQDQPAKKPQEGN